MPHTSRSTETTSRLGTSQFKNQLLACIPHLRAFARSLCGDRDEADDLTQEALMKAWQSRTSFVEGTNLRAWVFTILRNHFYSDRRKAWRKVRWNQEVAELIPAASDAAVWAAQLSDLFRAVMSLNPEQREALILVGAGQFSYADAAKVCNCAIGTTKSRVARARQTLLSTIDGDRPMPRIARPAPGGAASALLAQLDRAKLRSVDAASRH